MTKHLKYGRLTVVSYDSHCLYTMYDQSLYFSQVTVYCTSNNNTESDAHKYMYMTVHLKQVKRKTTGIVSLTIIICTFRLPFSGCLLSIMCIFPCSMTHNLLHGVHQPSLFLPIRSLFVPENKNTLHM